jgi:hypothetical protein
MPRILILFFPILFSLSAMQAQDDAAVPAETHTEDVYEEEAYEEEEDTPSPDMAYTESKVERRSFDEGRWSTLKKGMHYGPEKPAPKEKKKKDRKAPDLDLHDNSSTEFGPLVKTLFFVLIGGLLILIMVMMADGKRFFGPKDSKLKPAVSAAELEKIEENLQEAELDDPIRRAAKAGDYPLAVRLYYLAVLKELAVRNIIRWKRDKTNGAYLRELAGSPMFPTVQQVTLIFERVWYGKVELSRPDFEELEITLKNAVATASAAAGA